MGAVPILNLPNAYIDGLQLSIGSGSAFAATTLTVQPGQCRDSTNTYDIVLNEATTLISTNNGVNGLDTGFMVSNQWYYVFVIADPIVGLPTALLISQSQTDPILPAGYSIFRIIGVAKTPVAATSLLLAHISGNGNERKYKWDTVQFTYGGIDPSGLTIDCAFGIPQIDNVMGYFNIEMLPATLGMQVTAVPGSSSSIDGITLSADVVGINQFKSFKCMTQLGATNPEIILTVSNATGTVNLFTTGFDLTL